MISVHFQGKSFNITETPTSNAEEAEVEWFYEDLQDLLELIPKKDVLFIIGEKKSEVVQSCPTLCTPRTAARQASLSITNSWRLLRLMSIELIMPSNHLILCHPLLLLPSIFPNIRVFSNKLALHLR